MKKLPKIYQNEITKKIKNNKEICYLNNEKMSKNNIEETLNEIFNGLGYSYNIPVQITTKDNNIYNTGIVSKTNTNLITLDNDVIPITNIINIEIKKKVQK